jgi:hypothetical protein
MKNKTPRKIAPAKQVEQKQLGKISDLRSLFQKSSSYSLIESLSAELIGIKDPRNCHIPITLLDPDDYPLDFYVANLQKLGKSEHFLGIREKMVPRNSGNSMG